MGNYYEKAEMFAWMPLTGFDKDLPDKGVSNLIARTKFDLHGVCLFVFSPDIVHHHNGMAEPRILPPDNCSYYANPYNEERCRQEWTSHDLRDLTAELKKHGTECFISIMGVTLDNTFHDEWVYEHPELLSRLRYATSTLNVLKRFKDGTYYEDFFADKLCQVMEDYGLTGLHVADNFCPQGGCLCDGDFSMDMLEQFVAHTGFAVPEELLAEKEDNFDTVNKRGDWIWENCRAEWIEFMGWRWEMFWKKICDRLHAIGRKVFVLGMYCTDPFDTLYCKGVDLRRIVNAGVDYLMPNMAANSSSIARVRPWPYYQWSNMMPLSDAFAHKARKLNMLAVKDAAEEWDMLHHAPTFLDRDISFLPSYLRYTEDGSLKRCLDGYNICLADGIYEEEWKWLRERFDVAFDELPVKSLAPTFVWSDTAHDNMLREYIHTRRWTQHKFLYEINWAGGQMGAIVRTEHLTDRCGDLFVPNFDLLSEAEKQQLATYKGGRVIATASAENGFRPENYGITPAFAFEDTRAPYKNMAFVYNGRVEDPRSILAMLTEKGDTPVLEDPFRAEESHNTLRQVMPFQKVSAGFVKAVAALIQASYADLLTCTHPVVPMQMADGRLRVFILNDDRLHYGETLVTVTRKIKKVNNVSKFPMLPVKFTADGNFNFMSTAKPGDMRSFRVLVPQGGLGIVDIIFDD